MILGAVVESDPFSPHGKITVIVIIVNAPLSPRIPSSPLPQESLLDVRCNPLLLFQKQLQFHTGPFSRNHLAVPMVHQSIDRSIQLYYLKPPTESPTVDFLL